MAPLAMALALLLPGAQEPTDAPPLLPHRIGLVEGSCVSVPQFGVNEQATEWSDTVRRPGVLFWLLGVRVIAVGLGPWTFTVTNPNGAVVAQLASTDVTVPFEWWSPEVTNGGRLRLTGDLRGVQLAISQCVQGSSEPEVKSTIPPDDAKDISLYREERLYTWGKSVARLKVLDALGYYTCTAFLVAPNRLLTNEHCTSKSWKTMTAEFNAETGNLGQIDAQPVVAVIRTDPAIDLAVLRLGRPVTHPVVRIAATDVQDATSVQLVVVHHPSGKDKHASRDDCSTAVGGATAAAQFPHSCDTSKGSSGSPVFAAADGTVVGLHRKGFRQGTPGGRNQAVRASEIVKFLNSIPAEGAP